MFLPPKITLLLWDIVLPLPPIIIESSGLPGNEDITLESPPIIAPLLVLVIVLPVPPIMDDYIDWFSPLLFSILFWEPVITQDSLFLIVLLLPKTALPLPPSKYI